MLGQFGESVLNRCRYACIATSRIFVSADENNSSAGIIIDVYTSLLQPFTSDPARLASAVDFATTGDGLVAALQLLAVVARSGKPVSEVCHRFEPLPQLLRNVRYKNVQRRDGKLGAGR